MMIKVTLYLSPLISLREICSGSLYA
ncbi:hypothetical protein MED222_06105 [Vibrio sp. MED222]|nr:hypothetical protein MED222_06105 [Vibrio sp. MED222]